MWWGAGAGQEEVGLEHWNDPATASTGGQHQKVWSGFFLFFFIFLFFLTFIYFETERETEHERGRGRERGRHRIGNRLQAISPEPDAGLELTDHEIVT